MLSCFESQHTIIYEFKFNSELKTGLEIFSKI